MGASNPEFYSFFMFRGGDAEVCGRPSVCSLPGPNWTPLDRQHAERRQLLLISQLQESKGASKTQSKDLVAILGNTLKLNADNI